MDIRSGPPLGIAARRALERREAVNRPPPPGPLLATPLSYSIAGTPLASPPAVPHHQGTLAGDLLRQHQRDGGLRAATPEDFGHRHCTTGPRGRSSTGADREVLPCRNRARSVPQNSGEGEPPGGVTASDLHAGRSGRGRRRRGFSRSRTQLYTFEQMPSWLQFNPFIRTGYRGPMTTREALRSVFAWHNETMNIWSHFLPVFLVVYLLLIPPAAPSTLAQTQADQDTTRSGATGVTSRSTAADFAGSPSFASAQPIGHSSTGWAMFIAVLRAPGYLASLVTNPFAALSLLHSASPETMFLITLLGLLFIFVLSSAYHTFMPCCTTLSEYQRLITCDVFGVVMAIATSSLTFIWRGSSSIRAMVPGAREQRPGATHCFSPFRVEAHGSMAPTPLTAAAAAALVESSTRRETPGSHMPSGPWAFLAFLFFPIFGAPKAGGPGTPPSHEHAPESSEGKRSRVLSILRHSVSEAPHAKERRSGFVMGSGDTKVRYSAAYSTALGEYMEVLSLSVSLLLLILCSVVVAILIIKRPNLTAKDRMKLIGVQVALRLLIFTLLVWPRARNDGFDIAVNYHAMSFVFFVVGGVINVARLPERLFAPMKSYGKGSNQPAENGEDDPSAWQCSPLFHYVAQRLPVAVMGERSAAADGNLAPPRPLWYHILSRLLTYPEVDYILNSHSIWHYLSGLSAVCTLMGCFYDGAEHTILQC